MPSGHRKKPFSNKQKKEQLQTKREQKKIQERDEFGNVIRKHKGKHKSTVAAECDSDDSSEDGLPVQVKLMNPQPAGKKHDKGYDPNRYRLHFLKETQEEIERRKHIARQPFQTLSEQELEMDMDSIYLPGSVLDMPKRPPWDYKMSKHQLEAREESYFKDYLEKIMAQYSTEELSYFEINLETWRQLWRVMEMSDVLLLITDIRHPALHFSPIFYQYITKELKKQLILVLNKIDLVPPALVVAWKHYFQKRYPDVHIVCFTSFPKDKKEIEESQNVGKVLQKKRKRGTFSALGPKHLLQVCDKIVQGKVDLTTWKEKIDNELAGMEPEIETEVKIEEEPEDLYMNQSHEQYKNGILTIGCCGYPNVGKSSLINGLMGRKVVSVSKTPGHTKHFQTIYLTPHVKLCDSPGLVFPSVVSKPMQILAGIYPIAQVREPYTVVGYLSQRIPVIKLLKLTHPEAEGRTGEDVPPWSAMDVCDAWAEKRRFLTAKAGRNDVYRAANNILRLGLEGRLIMCSRPPGYTKHKEYWEEHVDTTEISTLQQKHRHITHRNSSSEEDEENFVLSQDSNNESDNENDGDDNDSDSSERCLNTGAGTSNPFALLGDD